MYDGIWLCKNELRLSTSKSRAYAQIHQFPFIDPIFRNKKVLW